MTGGLLWAWGAVAVLHGAQAQAARSDPDSAAVRREARDAQARFERDRRDHLPLTLGGRPPCEYRIGRFCFWHDDDAPPPPEEPARIRDARARLLTRLEHAAGLLPGDPWIAGQLVRYLVEQGDTAGALRAARACDAAPWWCGALEGLARHAAGDPAGAEAAFDAALAAAPDSIACRWRDVSLLLEEPAAGRYRRQSCAERATLERRLWWLARPLFLLPGNDRRAEHVARMAMAHAQQGTHTVYGFRWGRDQGEITVRYGWPVRWSAETPQTGGAFERPIVGYQRTPSFHFVPAPAALLEPHRAAAADWELRPRAPREGYSPAYADSFVALPHQAALFRRGDSALVIVAVEPGPPFGPGTEVALALAADERDAPAIARGAGAGTHVLAATTRWGAPLVSVEALDREGRRAGRERYALAPADTAPAARVTLSDLLLFEPPPPPAPESLPHSLDRVLPLALPSTEHHAGRRLGLFWEAYGLAPAGEPIRVTVAVRQIGRGWMRRAAAALGLAERPAPIRLEWEETARPEHGVAARALVLDLSPLSPGRYRIAVSVAVAGQAPTGTTREVRL